MTTYEKLTEEFGCAIYAVLGDLVDEEYDDEKIDRETLYSIARKVAFYLDK